MSMNKIQGCKVRIQRSKRQLVRYIKGRWGNSSYSAFGRYVTARCYHKHRKSLCDLFFEYEWLRSANNVIGPSTKFDRKRYNACK